MKAVRVLLPLLLAALFGQSALAAAGFAIPPAPTQRVTDPSGVLSNKTRSAIENELAAYEKATGHQIVVWIGQTTGDVPLETYTTETADRWKIGRRGHDDGAILFLFMKDRKIRIEVGYGLESALTDAASFHIINDEIRPRMRDGDVDGAVTAGVASMLKTITPSYALSMPTPSPAEGTASPAATALIVVVIALGILLVLAVIVGNVVASIRYGYLVMREGSAKARRDMRGWWLFGGGLGGGYGGGFGGGWGGGGGFGGGFSGGGGSFGGGGASGGW